MFGIAWCEKSDLSVLCLVYKYLNFKKTFAAPTFIKKKHLLPFNKKEIFVAFHITIGIILKSIS